MEKWWISYFNGPFYLLIYFNNGEFILKLTPEENSNYCIGFTIKQCILTWDVSIILHVFFFNTGVNQPEKNVFTKWTNRVLCVYVCEDRLYVIFGKAWVS